MNIQEKIVEANLKQKRLIGIASILFFLFLLLFLFGTSAGLLTQLKEISIQELVVNFMALIIMTLFIERLFWVFFFVKFPSKMELKDSLLVISYFFPYPKKKISATKVKAQFSNLFGVKIITFSYNWLIKIRFTKGSYNINEDLISEYFKNI